MKKKGRGSDFGGKQGHVALRNIYFSSQRRHTVRASNDNSAHGEPDGLTAALKCTNKALLMCSNTAA